MTAGKSALAGAGYPRPWHGHQPPHSMLHAEAEVIPASGVVVPAGHFPVQACAKEVLPARLP